MTASPAYAEFAVQSNFSFLCGASRPEELVVAAKLHGYAAMGLADQNTVAGVVRAWSQSMTIPLVEGEKPVSLPYHPGCRLVFADGTPDILAYPQNRKGWAHLCRLLTQANQRPESEKGAPLVYRGDLTEWGDEISLAVIPTSSGATEFDLLKDLRTRFGVSVWLAATPQFNGNDTFHLKQMASMAEAAHVPLMAVGNVLYHIPERRPLQDVMTAIRLNKTVDEAGYELNANLERYMKPPFEIARLFRRYPGALSQTIRFAERLHFSLEELHHNYPDETPAGVDPQRELERLTWEGARKRYPEGFPEGLTERIGDELRIVAESKYARYFLTVRNIVQFARYEAGILCQGRGSAANSVICYCLEITEVDPILRKGLFERFFSAQRGEPPDIDVDFEHERRDDVIAFIYKRYHEERTALAASVVTYRGRSAIREVSKALGLSKDVQSALSSSIWGWWTSELGKTEARAGGLPEEERLTKLVLDLANQINGFPRHLSQHVGGFVITKDRLDEIVPIVKTAMDERRMIEWDKTDLDIVKLFKVDVLALGMLSCLRRAFDLLEAHYGLRLTLDSLPKEDERVYWMMWRADTLGVFQIESRAQMSMLPRLRPKEFYDLVIEVAIVRPGPIQGDMVHPYLRRRTGLEPVTYPDEKLKAILKRTLGVPLFQEQAMKIAMDCAGYSADEADHLRRAMATFQRNGTIKDHRDRFIKGMTGNGYDEKFAERCFEQIKGFGDYGFPESHAASFALLVYASCWFKAFYPDVFCAAILNSQPMGFYAPAQLIRDAADHGVEIRPVDVNVSVWDSTLEPSPFNPLKVATRHTEMRGSIRTAHAVRLGLRRIKGLPEEKVKTLVERRGEGYESVRDLWLRSGLDVDEMEKLAEADAFRSMGLDRRAALWQVKALHTKSTPETLELFDRSEVRLPDNEPATDLPRMPLGEHVIHDYRSLGHSLKAHPVSFMRKRLDRIGITPNALLPKVQNGKRVTVAGLILVRQRPGKGNAIFLTLEDEKAIANIIIWARDFERFRPVVMGSRFVKVTGRLQCESGVIHITAQHMEDLTPWLAELSEKATLINPVAHADEVERPVNHRRSERKTSLILNPLAEAQSPGRSTLEDLSELTNEVMPKGRNFH